MRNRPDWWTDLSPDARADMAFDEALLDEVMRLVRGGRAEQIYAEIEAIRLRIEKKNREETSKMKEKKK